jgi:predicted porin
MKKALLPLAVAAMMPMTAMAVGPIDGKVYGKINLTVESVDDGSDTTSEVTSNASRIGVKGKSELSEGLYAIYKMEWEVSVDGSKDDLSARNRYVGLSGDFGTVIAGRNDTPFKLAQKKVDLFNDLAGDIKNAVDSENRGKNIIMYTTPKLADSVKVSAAFVASEDADKDDGTSLSISFDKAGLYLAAALETDVEAQGTDATRLVAQYKIGGAQIGALWEENEVEGEDSEDALHLSFAYKVDKATFKIQYTDSEIGDSKVVNRGDVADGKDPMAKDGEMLSLGVDYKLAKKTKAFAFYTTKENDTKSVEEDVFGIGLEHKF